jgi:hypothetical protein
VISLTDAASRLAFISRVLLIGVSSLLSEL